MYSDWQPHHLSAAIHCPNSLLYPKFSLRGLSIGPILLWFLSCSGLHAQQLSAKSFGGPSNDLAYAMCVTADGGFALVGSVRSQGNGSNDLWILRLNEFGCLLWSRVIGTLTQERATWVEALADGGLIVCGYSMYHPQGFGRHDFLAIRLDRDGSTIWEKFIGGVDSDYAFCVKPVPSGGFALLGTTRSLGEQGDFYLARIDDIGNLLWARHYESPFVDWGHELTILPDGGYLLLGSEAGFYFPTELEFFKPDADIMLIRTDSMGNEIWRKKYGGDRHELGRGIRAAGDGGYFVFGSTQSEGEGNFDLLLMKVDGNGDSLWSKTFGEPGWDFGESMDVGSNGDIFLCGSSQTPGFHSDVIVVKADPNGNLIWWSRFGGPLPDHGHSVRAMADGGCVVSGDTRNLGNGGQDAFFMRLAADGTPSEVIDPISRPVIYPNPVVGLSTINPYDNFFCGAYRCRIYDTAGRLVLEKQILSGKPSELSATELVPGNYVYIVNGKGGKMLQGKISVY